MAVACDLPSLEKSVACESCLPSGFRPLATIWQWMWYAGAGGDPKTILANAAQFKAFNTLQHYAAQVYFLALIKGGSTDPATLEKQAVNFLCCPTKREIEEFVIYLLAVTAGNGTDAASLMKRLGPIKSLKPYALQVETYLAWRTAVHSGVGADSLTVPAIAAAVNCLGKCLTVFSLKRIKVYLLCQLAQFQAGIMGGLPNVTDPAAGPNPPTPRWAPGPPQGFTYVLLADRQTNQITWTVDPAAPVTARVQVVTSTDGVTFYNEAHPLMSAAQPFALTPMGANAVKYAKIRFDNGPGTGGPWSALLKVSTLRQDSTLVAYWKLEEATNAPRNDSTPNAINLTDHIPGITQVPGLIGNGAKNDGVTVINELVVAAPLPLLQLGAGKSFTISLWHNFTDNTLIGSRAVVSKWGPSAARSEYVLQRNIPTNGFRWSVINLAGTQVNIDLLPDPANNATWYHIVVGYDDATQTIWYQINNGARTTAPCAGVQKVTLQEPSFALHNYSWPDLVTGIGNNSVLDEVGFWGRTLSTAEVALLYNSGAGLQYPF